MTSRSASSSASARYDYPLERVLLEALSIDFQQTASVWYNSGVLDWEGDER